MARKCTGNPVGAPPKEVNWTLFEDLCSLQCTQSEICSVLKLTDKTLLLKIKEHYGEDYSDTYKKYSEFGKSSLRRYQFAQAKKNPGMAIWLGKQWLGQKDHQDIVSTPNDEKLDALLSDVKSMKDKFVAKSEPISEIPKSDECH